MSLQKSLKAVRYLIDFHMIENANIAFSEEEKGYLQALKTDYNAILKSQDDDVLTHYKTTRALLEKNHPEINKLEISSFMSKADEDKQSLIENLNKIPLFSDEKKEERKKLSLDEQIKSYFALGSIDVSERMSKEMLSQLVNRGLTIKEVEYLNAFPSYIPYVPKQQFMTMSGNISFSHSEAFFQIAYRDALEEIINPPSLPEPPTIDAFIKEFKKNPSMIGSIYLRKALADFLKEPTLASDPYYPLDNFEVNYLDKPSKKNKLDNANQRLNQTLITLLELKQSPSPEREIAFKAALKKTPGKGSDHPKRNRALFWSAFALGCLVLLGLGILTIVLAPLFMSGLGIIFCVLSGFTALLGGLRILPYPNNIQYCKPHSDRFTSIRKLGQQIIEKPEQGKQSQTTHSAILEQLDATGTPAPTSKPDVSSDLKNTQTPEKAQTNSAATENKVKPDETEEKNSLNNFGQRK